MNRDPRVDAYVARANPALQPILEHIRARVAADLPQAVETIKWGGPAYTLDAKLLVITHAFKAHAALSFWRGSELRGQAQNKEAMGQFGRLTSIDDLPSDAELARLLDEAATLSKTAAAPRVAKKPARPTEIHADFRAALDAAPKARSALEAMPPSHAREYCEWINEAKRDGTRAKRIATAIEWLSEGKSRNWKYEKR